MKWTTEILQEEANKYETRTEFSKNSSSAYHFAHDKKILDTLFSNHINNGYSIHRKKEGYCTKEMLQEEANKYKTRWEFGKTDSASYNMALRKNYIDELFENHINNGYNEKHKKTNYWTQDRLQEEANKYNTRTEFQRKDRQAYSAAYIKNIIDELFENHDNKGYTNNEEWSKFRYVIYSYEISKYNRVYVGLTNNIKRRDKEHLYSDKEHLINFCKDNDISLPKYKILECNLNINDVRDKEKEWIEYYKNNNWNLFNVNKAGSVGTAFKRLSKKDLQKEVNKYKYRGDFQKYSSKYSLVVSRGLMNELFKNHTNKGYLLNRHKKNYWNIDILQLETNKYETRRDFYNNNRAAYAAAERSHLINKLFENHPNQGYKILYYVKNKKSE